MRRSVLIIGVLAFLFIQLFMHSIPPVEAAYADYGFWEQKANMTNPRIFAAVGVVDDRYLLVVAGREGATRLNYTEEYDVFTGTWTSKADYPVEMDAGWSAVIDGIFYVSGGFYGAYSTYAYNRTADAWTPKTDRPHNGWDGATVTLIDAIGNEVMYCLGGSTDSNTKKYVDVYCPNNDTWIQKANMTVGRAMFAASTHNGKIYVFGGSWAVPTNTSEVYDPSTNTWSYIADAPFHGIRALGKTSIDGKIFLLQCPSGTGSSPNTWYYDPATDSYTVINDFTLPTELYIGMDNVRLQGKVYVAGGREGASTYLQTLYAFSVIPAYSNPSATGAVTWYFSSGTHTVNTVPAYKLDEAQTATPASKTLSSSGCWNTYFGFRVYKVNSKGTATELTSDVSGVTYRIGDGEGLHNSVWTCPSRSLQIGFDALQIDFFIRMGDTGTWILKASFITSRLIQKTLENTTWTFSLYTKRVYSGGTTTATAYWDSNSYLSCVRNVEFEEPDSFEKTIYYYQSGDIIMGFLNPYIAVLGALFWAIPTLMVFATLYIRYQSFYVVLVVGILFGGSTGILTAIVPLPFSLLVGFIITACAAVWLFKTVR